MSEFFVQDKPYEKQPGTVCFAPYLDISITALAGRRSSDIVFKARIDTGADITCIPGSQAQALMPLLLGKPIAIRGHDGAIKRTRTHLMIISVHGYPDEEKKQYRPERGVLITDSSIGLIGMDIISKYWRLTFDGVSQKFSVECV